MKPTVQFIGEAEFLTARNDHEEWEYARVYTLDHPKLGSQWIRTSAIVQKFEDGSFETRNTVYKHVMLLD